MTLPLVLTVTALTALSAPASPFMKLGSSVPSVFKRATRPRAEPPTVVNWPPMITLPKFSARNGLELLSTATELTTAAPLENTSAGGTKEVSNAPSAVKRPTRLRAIPVRLANAPPTTTRLPPA